MSRHTCVVRVCLTDVTHGCFRAVGRLFDAIENCKSAIKAKSCKVLDISFSNDPDKTYNPRGDMQSITFDVATPFDGEKAELVLSHHFHTNPLLGLGEVSHDVIPMAEFKIDFHPKPNAG